MTPQDAYNHAQSGFTAYREHRFEDAEAVANSILAALPKDPNGLYLKGICRRALRDPAGALLYVEQACGVAPGQFPFELAAAQVLTDLEDYATARSRYEALARAFPDSFEAVYFRAAMERKAGDLAAARTAYEAAHRIMPDHLACLRDLAWISEAMRDWEAARRYGELLLHHESGAPAGISALAAAELAADRPEAALAVIDQHFDAGRAHPGIDAHEALGAYEAAMSAWQTGYGALRDHLAPTGQFRDDLNGLKSFQRLGKAYPTLEPASTSTGAAIRTPVFLVGFPRSGTTLLEQILGSHPDIRVSDEALLTQPIIASAGDSEESLRRFMATLPEHAEDLRAAYWKRADEIGAAAEGVFIDKLPLNLPWLGVLGQVFPGARVIRAVRDPRDAVLSAYKQLFELNASMVHTFTLEDTAALYDAAMSAGEAGLRLVPDSPICDIRYESLVGDMPKTVSVALESIGLSWQDRMAQYRDHLPETISTPSGPQVTQPIHDRSVGLWRKYEDAMTPVLPVLAPWVERWGYTGE